MLFEKSSLFKAGRKLASGRGLDDMFYESKQLKLNDRNSILEVKNPSDLDSKWNLYKRERINYGKPASHYHETAIARDINNVKKRRG